MVLMMLSPTGGFEAPFMSPSSTTRRSMMMMVTPRPQLFTVEENPKLRSDAWLANVMSLPRSQMLQRVGSHLTFTGLWTAGVIVANTAMPDFLPSVDPQPVQIVSTCITILLGFRTSQSYDRFWDGRNVWSDVWASCRSIARVGGSYLAPDDPERWDAAVAMMATYPHTLIFHLRNQTLDSGPEVEDCYLKFSKGLSITEESRHLNAKSLAAAAKTGANVPIVILDDVSRTFRDFRRYKRNQGTDDGEYPIANLEQHLDRLSRALCAAERIVMTPVPPSYSRHTSRVTTLWSLALPFCFNNVERPIIVLLSVLLVSWALYTLEEIGKVIEEPFGSDAEDLCLDLPLEKYAVLISHDVLRSSSLFDSISISKSIDGPPPPPPLPDVATSSKSMSTSSS